MGSVQGGRATPLQGLQRACSCASLHRGQRPAATGVRVQAPAHLAWLFTPHLKQQKEAAIIYMSSGAPPGVPGRGLRPHPAGAPRADTPRPALPGPAGGQARLGSRCLRAGLSFWPAAMSPMYSATKAGIRHYVAASRYAYVHTSVRIVE